MRFTRALVERYIAHSRAKNTSKWTRRLLVLLSWWRDELGAVDLRELDVREVVRHIPEGIGARAHRIAALKGLLTWLRVDQHLLDADPLDALHVPQSEPAQWRRVKEVPIADVFATRAELDGRWRDALDVLLGTAWHTTELERFARGGELRRAHPTERRAGAGSWGVLETRHKRRMPILTAVSRRVYLAALRVRKRGGLSLKWFSLRLREAAERAGVEPWTPGRLRTTVSSHALASGSEPGAVSGFLLHADQRTTRRWYTLHVASARVETLR
ncbi:MAG: hypothetical protein JST92_12855 [Deltaproteobacteria bacterium]|nr:hypothetical protein [Deltaproteobacteria bacterium]